MEVPLEPGEIEGARAQIRQAMPDRQRMVCLHVGAAHPSKMWPIERFTELAQRLGDMGWGIILIGTQNERELTGQIARALSPGSILDVAGMTNLFQMAALIDAADLFIGNDSGPLHIAIARGRPTIGLVGAGKPRYFMYDRQEAVILKNPDPAQLYDCLERKEIPIEWKIPVNEVFEHAVRLLPKPLEQAAMFPLPRKTDD
jgi:ADP-heptose:LPS heptosyltransferase